MNTHITAPRHFRLYGAVLVMAALLVTLLAVTLTAGPAQAQVGVGPGQLPRTGDNAEEYSAPIPCSEEAEPDASTAKDLDRGHYAVFDAFWDYEVGHLSNNFCPPAVTHKKETTFTGTKIVNTRTDANIHISETVFSVPDRYKVTVVDSAETNGNPSTVTGPKIDLASYPFLRDVVSAVKPDPESTAENPPNVFANNSLWWVKAENVPANTGANTPLILGFSTDLMEEADWYLADGPDEGTEPDPPVQFEFVAVHVLKDGTPQEAHVVGAHFFAFDPGASQTTPQWSNVTTATESEVNMFTGQYRHMQYIFTQPGQYLVQVHVQGHVRNTSDPAPAGADSHAEGWTQISPDKTITSPAEWYTFHVGPEADLDVALTAGAVSTTDSVSAVPITVTANNSGPNGAENVEVEINLPPGLGVPETLPAGATSIGCGVIAWKIGTMAGPTAPATKTTSTLTFNATVHRGAAGKLTVPAEIRSTTFDPDITDNAASAEVTLSGTHVRTPYFPGVTRSIPERATVGDPAGEPVAAVNPDARALSYSLTGRCNRHFRVDANGQIFLANGYTLDYEKQWEYLLILHVSDGVNASGEADTAIDDSTPVTIDVIDTSDDAAAQWVTFLRSNDYADVQPNLDLNRPAAGSVVGLTPTVHGLPAGATPTYRWVFKGGTSSTRSTEVTENAAGEATYTVEISWTGGSITATHTIDWLASGS